MNAVSSSDRLCVITLGVNGPVPADHPSPLFQDYPRGVARIGQQLKEHGFSGHLLAWDREYPAGSPTFAQARCAFKPFCFLAQSGGLRFGALAGCIDQDQAPIDVMFEFIKQDGYLIFEGAHSVGEYCKDSALATLGIDREESFGMPSCSASVIGLDLTNHRSLEFCDGGASSQMIK